MKKLLVATAVTGLVGTVNAQSAFEGFYGQIATGYESNSVSGLNGTAVESNPRVNGPNTNVSASNQNFGGAPLIVGAGYNFSIAPKWLIGIGVDYSTLSQKSSNFNSSVTGGNIAGVTSNGSNIKVSDRFNVFVTPGYEIDKDKLLYFKAGYSSVKVSGTDPSSVTIPGVGTLTNAQAGQTVSTTGFGTISGYVLGLGYKQMITKGIYGFAEGNYMTYGKPSITTTTTYTDGSGFNTVNYKPSLSSYQLLVGIGYKF